MFIQNSGIVSFLIKKLNVSILLFIATVLIINFFFQLYCKIWYFYVFLFGKVLFNITLNLNTLIRNSHPQMFYLFLIYILGWTRPPVLFFTALFGILTILLNLQTSVIAE